MNTLAGDGDAGDKPPGLREICVCQRKGLQGAVQDDMQWLHTSGQARGRADTCSMSALWSGLGTGASASATICCTDAPRRKSLWMSQSMAGFAMGALASPSWPSCAPTPRLRLTPAPAPLPPRR